MTSATTRYAIFFAPAPESALWRFGSSVLGYDAATARDVEQFVPPSVPRRAWHAFTDEPRRYGFHATMKAPFRLAEGVTEAELISALTDFCLTEIRFELILEVSRLNGFVALTPREVPSPFPRLERKVVEMFDRFRAPLTETERERRLGVPLTSRQRDLLDRYGYPYVLDEFRFHMTISGRLHDEMIAAAIRDLEIAFAERCPPAATFDRLALFREDAGRFRIVAGALFGGG